MGAGIRLVGGRDVSKPSSGIKPAEGSQRVGRPPPQGRGKNKLSDRAIAKWIKGGMSGKLFDGAGLFLAAPGGVPRWYVKYRHKGKETTYSVGRYGQGGDEYSLAKARDECTKVREWLDKGLAPNLEKRAAKNRISAAQGETFAVVADEWFAKAKAEWSAGHAAARRWTLDNDLLPKLGAIPIADLDAPTALAALELISKRGAHEMCAKARIVGSLICRYAIVKGRIEQDPFAHLAKAIKRPPVINYPALSAKEMPALFKALAKLPAELSTRLCFYFQVATAVRPAEARHATWGEIDGKVWRISAERMKMREPFVQPLSPLALAILERASELRQTNNADELIFPGYGGRHGGALSENASIALLARAGVYGRATPHGFRSSFASWAHEREFDGTAVELCLAHKPPGIAGVYNRSQYIPTRRKILTAWGDQLQKWGMRLP